MVEGVLFSFWDFNYIDERSIVSSCANSILICVDMQWFQQHCGVQHGSERVAVSCKSSADSVGRAFVGAVRAGSLLGLGRVLVCARTRESSCTFRDCALIANLRALRAAR